MIELPPRPMEPVLWPDSFDDDDWAFQIKWDGMRLLTAAEAGGVRAFNRHGVDRTAWFPEVAGLPRQLLQAGAVLDGEAVAFLAGKPSFRRLMQRVRSRDPGRLRGEAPMSYMVFDLLALGDTDLRPLPWEERQARLRKVLEPGGFVALVETLPGAGRRLFQVAAQHDLEGIVAKRRDSPYVGGRTDLWRKVKYVKRRPFVIAGYRLRGGRLASLLLAAYDEAGRLTYVGNAGTGLDERTMEALHQVLKENALSLAPVITGWPRAPQGSRDAWVLPALTVLVEFLEWTEGGHLRAPVIRSLNPTTPAACRLD